MASCPSMAAEEPSPEPPAKGRRRASKKPAGPPIDVAQMLGNLLRGVDPNFTPKESVTERASRLRIAEKDADSARRKDMTFFNASLAIVVAATVAALWILVLSGRPPAETRWAEAILTLIVGGVLGYGSGKATTAKPGG